MRPVAANGLILRHGRAARHGFMLRIRRVRRERLSRREGRVILRHSARKRGTEAAVGREADRAAVNIT
jgi:hypothetical protein